MKNNKGIASILILLIITGVLVAGGAYYFWSKNNQKQVACTMEAKLCPDGSAVGRTGPDCEFASCPENTSLPEGYTLEAYSVEKKLEAVCSKNSDCETPGEYLILSRCPFTSICLEKKCAVVCPAYISLSWDEAEAMINNCEVEKLGQRHNRLIALYLKDGRQFSSIEPILDQIVDLADSLEGKCGKIQIMTE
ncbi:MAG: hypothetical protein E4H47_01355 [Parcubacteria group bacterium]|nr:MAG: hypothetical protein E4H47_01355 [Parcubacteria group bacterium]